MVGARDFRRQNSIIFSLIGTLAIGSIVMFWMGISGQKYARVEFCFKPNKKSLVSEKSITKFCNEDKRHVVPEVSWNAAQFEPTNPYYQSETAFIIPNKASRLKVILASNPNYGWYLVTALGCSVAAAGMCQQRINVYKSDFAEYLAQTKKSLKENVLITESDLKVYGHTVAEKEATATDSISRQYQSFRDVEKSEGEVYTEELNAKLNNELVTAQHQLNLAQLGKETAENIRDKTKAEKEINKILGTKNSDKENDSNSPNKQLINDLIQALEQHEGGWLYKILKIQKPLWIVGGQGAGKSTLAASIVLLRHYIFGWELIEIIDAHGQKNCSKAWKRLMELGNTPPAVIGAYNNYEDIDQSFLTTIKRWADRTEDDTPTQSLVDEYTNLSDAEECKENAGRFTKHSLSDIRKASECWIFIAHFFTATATGDAKGTHKARVAQTIQIEKFSADGLKPLSNVIINGLVDEKGKAIENLEATIPAWLMPENIWGHFNDKPIQFEE